MGEPGWRGWSRQPRPTGAAPVSPMSLRVCGLDGISHGSAWTAVRCCCPAPGGQKLAETMECSINLR